MEPERFQRQLRFIAELDKLKQVERRTYLLDQSRRETVAEHSWHIAVMALLLAEYSNAASLDLSKVIRMALVHDIVEIDAGDTFCYDAQGNADKAQREQRAADRLFGLLPDDQAAETKRTKTVIPAGTYAGQDSDVVTTSLPVVAFATAEVYARAAESRMAG